MSGSLPARLGKYDIRGTLGRGAMGTVYDGWDPLIERRVAIKTVRIPAADDEEATEALARFKREAQAAGRLAHPNIVGVFDYGETDEVAFIVMEFVAGRSLKDELAGGRLAAVDAVRIMQDVLAGLAYSHGRGVVHRDIKPANVMLTDENQAKIADFGIARIESSSMTQAGTVMGTPAYMSPEQFMGETVDRRTDIYSCGVMLFQLLTGERPFEGSMASIMHKATTTVPSRPSDLAVTAPPALDAVVARAMARRPADRYDTASAFADALRASPDPAAPQVADPASDATTIVPRGAPIPRQATPPQAPPPTATTAKAGAPLRPVLAIAGLALAGAAGVIAWTLLPGTPPVQQAALAPSPVQPAEPSQPPEPHQPAQPPQPTQPTAPPQPTQPTAPTQPAQPSQPTAPPQPTQPTAPTQPAQPSQPVLPPQPGPSAAALSQVLAGVPCALLRATPGTEGGVTVTGLVGTPAAEDTARVASGPATWSVRRFKGPYCPVLDLLRALPDTAPALALTQDGGPAPLHDNQPIALHAAMPGFAGVLHVAYVQYDDQGPGPPTASPLVPGPGYPAQTYAARTSVALGGLRTDGPSWTVGPPFGTDMVVAVVSTSPLFAKPPPADQPLAAYLASLGTAIDGLRRRGGTVAAATMVLDTRPGR